MTFLLVVALGLLRWPLLLVCAIVGRGRLRADTAETRRRKTARVVAAVVGLVVIGDLILDESSRISPSPDAGGGERITVLTYNVLFDGGDAQATADVLLSEDADVVFLQEVSVTRAADLHRTLAARYPHRQIALPQGRGHGLVTYAKRPLRPIESWSSERGNVVGHCLHMDPMVVCNVHLTSPSVALDDPARFFPVLLHNERSRRLEWGKIEDTALAAAEGPLLLVGDVNTMVVEPLFRAIRTRWVDAYRAVRPLSPGTTYPHGSHGPPDKLVRPGVPFVRPDYVLLSPDVLPIAAHTVAAGGSDHRPVVVTVELPSNQ